MKACLAINLPWRVVRSMLLLTGAVQLLWGADAQIFSVSASFEAGVPGYDTVVAAGPASILLANNGRALLRTKSGAQIATGWDVFSSVLAPGEGMADPRVLFDEESGRFFISALASAPGATCVPGTCVAHFLLAVSKTSTPAGFTVRDWYTYALDAARDGSKPTDHWVDFEQLGVGKTGGGTDRKNVHVRFRVRRAQNPRSRQVQSN